MFHKKFIADYQALISSASVSAIKASLDMSNKGVVDYLASRFADSGFKITIQPVPGARDKWNMLAAVGGGAGGLLLSGHIDTVPCDESLWQSDPFKVREHDNRLYGLGSCDMKGFFAFILAALETVELGKLQKPLYILATADEETTMAGARFFAQQQLIKPDVAIIGEPTELKPVYKHKGHMAHTVQVQGQAGHSSDPEAGVNAIEVMHQAIAQLLKLKQQLKQAERDQDFAVPHSTLNLGHIHGGDGENRICSHCCMNFDLRPLPVVPEDHVIEQIDQALAPVMAAYSGRVSRQAMYPSSAAFECANQHGIVQLAEQLTGFNAQSANYATEAPHLAALGCDTLVLGPGSIEQAHQANEYLHTDYIQPTVTLLQQIIGKVCLR